MTIAVDLGRKATKQTKILNRNINTKKIVLNLNEALHFVLALATIFLFLYMFQSVIHCTIRVMGL